MLGGNERLRGMHERRVGSVAVLALALLPRTAIEAESPQPGPGVHCATTVSADTLMTAVPLEVNGQRYRLELSRSGAPGGQRMFSLTLSRHHRLLLESDGNTTATGFTVANRFGASVHGLRSLALASTDGRTVTGTMNGRALKPFTLGGGTTALEFVDGGKPPKIRVKPAFEQALQQLKGLETSCAAHSAAAADDGVQEYFLGLDCTLCEAACGIALWGCDAGAALGFIGCEAGTVGTATLGCVAAFSAAEAGCLETEDACSNNCETGSSCCPVACAGGTPNAASSTEFCARTCNAGSTCCGGDKNPNGVCCDKAADCCGTSTPTCLEGIFAGDRCVDQHSGAFCFAGEGDVCGSTDQPGRAPCCPGSDPVCRNASENLCCKRGAGDACGNAQERKCCPEGSPVCRNEAAGLCCPTGAGDVCGDECCSANTPHCGGGTCCKQSDACGGEGDCCPSQNLCRGKTCCASPSTTCGSACCNADERCVDPAKGLCCGILTGIACGSECCDSTTDACVDGASVCGSACCGAGEYCAAGDTCMPCRSGEVACRAGDASSGPSTCCAPDQACCGSPLQCAAPSVCALPPPK